MQVELRALGVRIYVMHVKTVLHFLFTMTLVLFMTMSMAKSRPLTTLGLHYSKGPTKFFRAPQMLERKRELAMSKTGYQARMAYGKISIAMFTVPQCATETGGAKDSLLTKFSANVFSTEQRIHPPLSPTLRLSGLTTGITEKLIQIFNPCLATLSLYFLRMHIAMSMTLAKVSMPPQLWPF